MAELTRLCQTTEAVSLSFQALLECLPLTPTTPPMPTADAEQIVYVCTHKHWQLIELQWFTPQAPSSAPALASPQPEEASKEQRAKVCECAAMRACHAGYLPYADLDLLSPPPLAFPHREALYKDVWGIESKMDPIKVAGVAEWPEPRSKKEVQAFLGFVNFYWRFIQGFFYHACPLFDLTVKDTAWWWEPPQQAAFDALKQSVTLKPVLLFLDDDSPFCVEADSSDFATGAVLSQQSKEDGK
ncbi:hypothetical protein E4T56_gene421 [Termitomyces sp. T112]|nr:hypothetical protein E4T56_gene421 [Termitomyces sp. T112]